MPLVADQPAVDAEASADETSVAPRGVVWAQCAKMEPSEQLRALAAACQRKSRLIALALSLAVAGQNFLRSPASPSAVVHGIDVVVQARLSNTESRVVAAAEKRIIEMAATSTAGRVRCDPRPPPACLPAH